MFAPRTIAAPNVLTRVRTSRLALRVRAIWQVYYYERRADTRKTWEREFFNVLTFFRLLEEQKRALIAETRKSKMSSLFDLATDLDPSSGEFR